MKKFQLCSVSFSGYSQKSNFVKANLFSPLVRSGSFFYESDFEIGAFDGFGVRAGVTVGIGF